MGFYEDLLQRIGPVQSTANSMSNLNQAIGNFGTTLNQNRESILARNQASITNRQKDADIDAAEQLAIATAERNKLSDAAALAKQQYKIDQDAAKAAAEAKNKELVSQAVNQTYTPGNVNFMTAVNANIGSIPTPDPKGYMSEADITELKNLQALSERYGQDPTPREYVEGQVGQTLTSQNVPTSQAKTAASMAGASYRTQPQIDAQEKENIDVINKQQTMQYNDTKAKLSYTSKGKPFSYDSLRATLNETNFGSNIIGGGDVNTLLTAANKMADAGVPVAVAREAISRSLTATDWFTSGKKEFDSNKLNEEVAKAIANPTAYSAKTEGVPLDLLNRDDYRRAGLQVANESVQNVLGKVPPKVTKDTRIVVPPVNPSGTDVNMSTEQNKTPDSNNTLGVVPDNNTSTDINVSNLFNGVTTRFDSNTTAAPTVSNTTSELNNTDITPTNANIDANLNPVDPANPFKANTTDQIYNRGSDLVQNREGFELQVYADKKDANGNPLTYAAGYGHNLTLEELKIYPPGTQIPPEVAAKWFQEDFGKAYASANKQADELGAPRGSLFRSTLASMHYQLGEEGAKGFKDAFTALKSHDYKKAKSEFKDSAWAKQTPKRMQDMVAAVDAFEKDTNTEVIATVNAVSKQLGTTAAIGGTALDTVNIVGPDAYSVGTDEVNSVTKVLKNNDVIADINIDKTKKYSTNELVMLEKQVKQNVEKIGKYGETNFADAPYATKYLMAKAAESAILNLPEDSKYRQEYIDKVEGNAGKNVGILVTLASTYPALKWLKPIVTGARPPSKADERSRIQREFDETQKSYMQKAEDALKERDAIAKVKTREQEAAAKKQETAQTIAVKRKQEEAQFGDIKDAIDAVASLNDQTAAITGSPEYKKNKGAFTAKLKELKTQTAAAEAALAAKKEAKIEYQTKYANSDAEAYIKDRNSLEGSARDKFIKDNEARLTENPELLKIVNSKDLATKAKNDKITAAVRKIAIIKNTIKRDPDTTAKYKADLAVAEKELADALGSKGAVPAKSNTSRMRDTAQIRTKMTSNEFEDATLGAFKDGKVEKPQELQKTVDKFTSTPSSGGAVDVAQPLDDTSAMLLKKLGEETKTTSAKTLKFDKKTNRPMLDADGNVVFEAYKPTKSAVALAKYTEDHLKGLYNDLIALRLKSGIDPKTTLSKETKDMLDSAIKAAKSRIEANKKSVSIKDKRTIAVHSNLIEALKSLSKGDKAKGAVHQVANPLYKSTQDTLQTVRRKTRRTVNRLEPKATMAEIIKRLTPTK